MTRSDAAPRLTTRDWIIQVLGWLALIASLALLSPGVVLKASAEPLKSEAAGESCEAGAVDPERIVADLEQQVQAMRLEAAIQADLERAGQAGDDAVIVLDGRGYNYRNTPAHEPAPAR